MAGTLGLQKCPICGGSGTAPRSGLFYAYRTPVTVLTALQANVPVNITIGGWDFEWLELTGESTGAFTFTIQDVSSARNFQNTAIHSSEILGNGQNPFPLLDPYIFPKQGTLQIVLNDVSNAGNSIALCFIGRNLGEGVSQ